MWCLLKLLNQWVCFKNIKIWYKSILRLRLLNCTFYTCYAYCTYRLRLLNDSSLLLIMVFVIHLCYVLSHTLFDLMLMTKSCFHYCPSTIVVLFKLKYGHKKVYICINHSKLAYRCINLNGHYLKCMVIWIFIISQAKIINVQIIIELTVLYKSIYVFQVFSKSLKKLPFKIYGGRRGVHTQPPKRESQMRVYTREQPFACLQYNTYCYNTFSRKDNPKMHHKHVHAWEKPCSGKECGKCFSYHQDVERHNTNT